MIDVDVTERGYTRAKRHMVAGVAFWLALGVSGAASATTTLQDMFNGGSFTQDGLTFSNFNPVLNANFSPTTILQGLQQPNPDPQALAAQMFDFSPNPQPLAAQMFDFGPTGVFSRTWVWGDTNPAGADPDQIDLTVLEDDQATPGVDPGFSLAGNSQWHVDAGYSTPNDSSDDLATAQLSAFSYEVSTSGNPINSASLAQVTGLKEVGPDILSFSFSNGVELPDVAGSFALQFVLTPDDKLLATNLTLDGGVQSLTGVMQFSDLDAVLAQLSAIDPSLLQLILRQDQLDLLQQLLAELTNYDLNAWSGFADQSQKIKVVNVVGVGASSGGGFTMESVSQRIDPPPPSDIPEPGVLLLMGVGMLGVGAWRRRSSGRLPGIA